MMFAACAKRCASTLVSTALLVVFFAGAATAQTAGFVYVLRDVNGGASEIYGFRLDGMTGVLTPLAGFPAVTGGTGTGHYQQLTYANGRLFVVNDGSNTLSVFNVNRTTGALTAAPAPTFRCRGGEGATDRSSS